MTEKDNPETRYMSFDFLDLMKYKELVPNAESCFFLSYATRNFKEEKFGFCPKNKEDISKI